MDEKPTRNGFLKGILVGGIAVFLVFGFYRLAQEHPGQPSQAQRPINGYSPLLCADAFKTEKDYQKYDPHHYDGIDHIDIRLEQGCFSGMVTLPQEWADWRYQMLGNDPNSWVCFWYAGFQNPNGCWWSTQMNQDPTTHSWGDTKKSFRLQGAGTLRIFTPDDVPRQ